MDWLPGRVTSGGDGFRPGIRIGLTVECHRGGIYGLSGRLAGGGCSLAGDRGRHGLHMTRVNGAGEGGGGSSISRPVPYRCTPCVNVCDLPLRIEGQIGIQRQGSLIRVCGSGAVSTGVPAVERIAVPRKGVGVECKLLARSRLLRRHRPRAAVGIKGNSYRCTDEIIARSGGAVMKYGILRAEAQRLPCRIRLTVGIVRLKDGVGTRIRHAFEVTAGDQRGVIGIGIIVLVGIGSGGLRRVDTSGDGSDPGVCRIIDCVISRRGAVGVDLQALAKLVDDRQIRGVGAAVLDSDAVGGNDCVLYRTDVCVEVNIGIGRCSCGAIGVRCGGRTGIQCTGVVIDAAHLLLRRGRNNDRIAAAVDGGNFAQIRHDLIATADFVACANEVDHRGVVVGDIDPRLAAVNDGTGAVRCGDSDNVKNIGFKGADRCAAVEQDRSVGGADCVAGQRSQMSAVVQRVG